MERMLLDALGAMRGQTEFQQQQKFSSPQATNRMAPLDVQTQPLNRWLAAAQVQNYIAHSSNEARVSALATALAIQSWL